MPGFGVELSPEVGPQQILTLRRSPCSHLEQLGHGSEIAFQIDFGPHGIASRSVIFSQFQPRFGAISGPRTPHKHTSRRLIADPFQRPRRL
jgi:hypothetical protein